MLTCTFPAGSPSLAANSSSPCPARCLPWELASLHPTEPLLHQVRNDFNKPLLKHDRRMTDPAASACQQRVTGRHAGCPSAGVAGGHTTASLPPPARPQPSRRPACPSPSPGLGDIASTQHLTWNRGPRQVGTCFVLISCYFHMYKLRKPH